MTAGLSALSPSASTIGIASASMAACRDTGKQVSTHCMPGPGESGGGGGAGAAIGQAVDRNSLTTHQTHRQAAGWSGWSCLRATAGTAAGPPPRYLQSDAMAPCDHGAAMQYCSSGVRGPVPASKPSPLASVTTSASRLFLAGFSPSTIAQITQAAAAEPAAVTSKSVASAGSSKEAGAAN